jgi:hypothetical protein
MIHNSTNTPVYGGYHPNDVGYQWFGNFRIDSKRVIKFFNSVAMKAAPLVHSVNRGELIFRTSDGGFSMQAIRIRVGLTMVIKAWRNNNDLAHADISRSEVVLGKENSVEEDTLTWLESSWSSLSSLITLSGLEAITLPEFEDLVSDSEIVESGSPPFFSDYFGTGSSSSYEEPSPSSEYGDLPEFSTDG